MFTYNLILTKLGIAKQKPWRGEQKRWTELSTDEVIKLNDLTQKRLYPIPRFTETKRPNDPGHQVRPANEICVLLPKQPDGRESIRLLVKIVYSSP